MSDDKYGLSAYYILDTELSPGRDMVVQTDTNPALLELHSQRRHKLKKTTKINEIILSVQRPTQEQYTVLSRTSLSSEVKEAFPEKSSPER